MKNNNQKLSTNGLYKRYGKRWVVRDVDLNVNKGEIVGLLGPNGAGKTTTFYMITGMIKPTKGHIILNERDITNRAMYQRSRSGIGYLSQEPSIFGKLSVEDNLRLVLEMTNLTKKEQAEKVKSIDFGDKVSFWSTTEGRWDEGRVLCRTSVNDVWIEGDGGVSIKNADAEDMMKRGHLFISAPPGHCSSQGIAANGESYGIQ